MPSSPVKDEGTDDRRQRSVAATTVDGSGSRRRDYPLTSGPTRLCDLPALRVILSFRLLRSVFRRENLLTAAEPGDGRVLSRPSSRVVRFVSDPGNTVQARPWEDNHLVREICPPRCASIASARHVMAITIPAETTSRPRRRLRHGGTWPRTIATASER